MILITRKRGGQRKFTGEAKPFFKQLYIDEGLSSRKMGELLGVDNKTVLSNLRRFDIPTRTLSEAWKLRRITQPMTEETKRRMSIAKQNMSEETKRKMSEHGKTRIGEKSPNWNNGSSFLPYCYKFNEAKKEEIRNQYSRVCIVSGISALQNGQRLSVDHADENKMQGCNGIPFRLVPLTRKVHGKMGNRQNHLLLELLLLSNKKAEMNYEFEKKINMRND